MSHYQSPIVNESVNFLHLPIHRFSNYLEVGSLMEQGNLALELKRCLWQAGDVFPNGYHLLMGQIVPVSRTWQVKEIVGHQ